MIFLCHVLLFFNPGSNIDDLISALRNQNILTEVHSGSGYESVDFHSTALNNNVYVSFAPHSAALNVFKVDKVRRDNNSLRIQRNLVKCVCS